jgi:hypothetical protein
MNRYSGEEGKQFRRVIRYLKRWKDYQKSKGVMPSITGIAITILVYYHFSPQYKDRFANTPDDLLALKSTLDNYLTELRMGNKGIILPVDPKNNLLEKFTTKQLEDFETKITELQKAVAIAYNDVDPIRSCVELRAVFGDDFPEMSLDESAKRNPPAITHSGQSA